MAARATASVHGPRVTGCRVGGQLQGSRGASVAQEAAVKPRAPVRAAGFQPRCSVLSLAGAAAPPAGASGPDASWPAPRAGGVLGTGDADGGRGGPCRFDCAAPATRPLPCHLHISCGQASVRAFFPSFNLFFPLAECSEFFTYCGHHSFIRRPVLQVWGLSFHSLNRVFGRSEVLMF